MHLRIGRGGRSDGAAHQQRQWHERTHTHTQYTRRETKFGEGRQKARESRAGPFECICVWRLWVWHRRFILSSFSLIGRSADQFNQSIERLKFHSTLQPPYIYKTQPKSNLRRRLRLRLRPPAPPGLAGLHRPPQECQARALQRDARRGRGLDTEGVDGLDGGVVLVVEEEACERRVPGFFGVLCMYVCVCWLISGGRERRRRRRIVE